MAELEQLRAPGLAGEIAELRVQVNELAERVAKLLEREAELDPEDLPATKIIHEIDQQVLAAQHAVGKALALARPPPDEDA